jgi:uncharacterized membrane protein YfcA
MTELIICLVALFGSALTFFSGFGLGTILVPVFALFFPIELAIALTAIVHFLNNLFKLSLIGKNINKKTVLDFGIPSIIGAIFGAYLLTFISKMNPIFEYTFYDHTFQVMPVKLTIAILLLLFALFEIIPKLSQLEFDTKYLKIGGLLSGFFGGLSGNQGALRTVFLIRANLSKESFIATGVVIACIVDVIRLSVYGEQIFKNTELNYSLIIISAISAFIGAFIGNKLLKKVTIVTIKYVVSVVLIIFSLLLGLGII